MYILPLYYISFWPRKNNRCSGGLLYNLVVAPWLLVTMHATKNHYFLFKKTFAYIREWHLNWVLLHALCRGRNASQVRNFRGIGGGGGGGGVCVDCRSFGRGGGGGEKQQTVKNQYDKMQRRLRFHKYQTFLSSRSGMAPYFAHNNRGAFATFFYKKKVFYCMSHSCGSF